jgi:predicted lipid carrier protein YhbT
LEEAEEEVSSGDVLAGLRGRGDADAIWEQRLLEIEGSRDGVGAAELAFEASGLKALYLETS